MANEYKIRNGSSDDIRLVKYEGDKIPSPRCPIRYYLVDLRKNTRNEIIGTYFIYGLEVEEDITIEIIRDHFFVGYNKHLSGLRIKEVNKFDYKLPDEAITFNYTEEGKKMIITTCEPTENIDICYYCNIISNIPFGEEMYRFFIYGINVDRNKSEDDIMKEMMDRGCALKINNLGIYIK